METIITNKNKKRLCLVLLGMFSIMILIPLVLAYPAVLPAYDLYTIFVEAIFGGFWLSVFGLALLMYFMMAIIGQVSQFTNVVYCSIFVYAMAIGYTQPLIIIFIWIVLLGTGIFQIFRSLNSGSTA